MTAELGKGEKLEVSNPKRSLLGSLGARCGVLGGLREDFQLRSLCRDLISTQEVS